MALDVAELEKEAKQGSVVAQGILGMCLLYGYETPVDYDTAFQWLNAASRQGASRPTLHLGLMFAKGLEPRRTSPKLCAS
jgi:TPR repeat protein